MSQVDLRYHVMSVRSPDRPETSIGTAFLVSQKDSGYAVTCYHVVGAHEQVDLYFEPGQSFVRAELVPQYSNRGLDVAVLKLLDSLPDGLETLELRPQKCADRGFKSFGFPQGFRGLWAKGTIVGLVPSPKEAPYPSGMELLQLKTTDVAEGMSGAPVVLVDSEDTVGLLETNGPIIIAVGFLLATLWLSGGLADSVGITSARNSRTLGCFMVT